MATPPDSVLVLIEDGRFLEAVDELSEAARTTGTAEYDRLLVELRYKAFAMVDRTPGIAEWPRSFADPFPGVDGVPIMGADALDAEAIGGAITNHGCLQVTGLLSKEDVAWFTETIDRAFVARTESADWTEAQVAAEAAGTENLLPRPGSPWFDPFEMGLKKATGFGSEQFVRVCDVPSAMRRFTEALSGSGVSDAIRAYLGERPAMIANKWILRRSPHGAEGTDFHQDGQFLGGGIRTLDCWIALSDCGPGTNRGGLDLVPRRFPLLRAGEGSFLAWTLSEEVVRSAMPGADLVSPVFSAGDALLFDELLPHRSGYGPELAPRYAIESWFVAPSTYPAKHVPLML